jgi:hypothetical protein
VVEEDGTCDYHRREHKVHDRPYHEKIARNLLQPASAYLSPSEIAATMNGRYRGDARRLDVYVLPDPLLYELEEQ